VCSTLSTVRAGASIVPVATIGYVDVGAPKKGSVGFGTL